jgi:hypothetical protein
MPAPTARPLPGQRGFARRPPKAPPAGRIVGACVSFSVAFVFLVSAGIFFALNHSQWANQPDYQAQIDRLWSQPGAGIPGQEDVDLDHGVSRYYAYLDSPQDEAGSAVDVTVIDLSTGQPVDVAGRSLRPSFQHDGRVLTPKASFRVPVSGRYEIRASARGRPPRDATVKVGPESGLVDGTLPAVSRNLGVFCLVVAALLVAIGVRLIRSHRRLSQAHRDALERYYRTASVEWQRS